MEAALPPPSSISAQHRRTISAPTTPVSKATKNHDVDKKDDRAFFNSPQQQPCQRRLRSRSGSTGSNRSRKLIVESPRIYESDAILFPASKHGPLRNTNYLQSYETRYQYIQQQQQQQQQQHDGGISVLRIEYSMIHHRQVSPTALQHGILPQCAIRIQTLHLPILPAGRNHIYDHSNETNHNRKLQQLHLKNVLRNIVSWMDAISTIFPNLKYIFIQPPHPESQQLPVDDQGNGENKATDSFKMTIDTKSSDHSITDISNNSTFTVEERQLLRAYVVYRLPILHSIDGIIVSTKERNDANGFFMRDKKSTPSQRSKSESDIRKICNSDGKPCYTHQARAKLFAGHQMGTTKSKSMTLRQQQKKLKGNSKKSRKNINDGLEPLSYCLLDGMIDEDEDDENCNPVGKHTHTAVADNFSRRVIMVSDDAVEVKQQPLVTTKMKQQAKTKINNSNPNDSTKPSTTFNCHNHSNIVPHRCSVSFDPPLLSSSNPPLSFDHQHFHHDKWEYISATGESSVHAMNACAGWTAACGTLTSSLYNFRSLSSSTGSCKNMNRQRQQQSHDKSIPIDTSNTGMIHDLRMKTDRIKTKFHLLQQNRLRKDTTAQQNHNVSTHHDGLQATSTTAIASQRQNNDYEIGMLSLDEFHHDVKTDNVLLPLSLSRNWIANGPSIPMTGATQKEFTYPKSVNPLSIVDSTGQETPFMNCTDTLSVTTEYAFISKNNDKSFIITPQTPKGDATPSIGSLRITNLQNVAIPYVLTHTRSSPSKLPSLDLNVALRNGPFRTKHSLPPPCPGATRRQPPQNPMTLIRHSTSQSKTNDGCDVTFAIAPPLSIPRCSGTSKALMLHRIDDNKTEKEKGDEMVQSSFDNET